MIDSVNPETGSASADLKKSRRKTSATAGTPKIDRLPPHSIEAEQGVLGASCFRPNDCMGECIEKLKPGPPGLLRSAPPDAFSNAGGDVRREAGHRPHHLAAAPQEQPATRRRRRPGLLVRLCPTPSLRRPISSITWTSSWKNICCAK